MTVTSYKNEIKNASDHIELKKVGSKMYTDETLNADAASLKAVIFAYHKRRAKLDKEFMEAAANKEFKSQLYYINTMAKAERDLNIRVARAGKTLYGLVGKGVFSKIEAEILFRTYRNRKRKLIREGRITAQLNLAA